MLQVDKALQGLRVCNEFETTMVNFFFLLISPLRFETKTFK